MAGLLDLLNPQSEDVLGLLEFARVNAPVERRDRSLKTALFGDLEIPQLVRDLGSNAQNFFTNPIGQTSAAMDSADQLTGGLVTGVAQGAQNLINDPQLQVTDAIEAAANLTGLDVIAKQKVAQEAQVEAQEKQLVAASADMAQQSKVGMIQAGATKEDLSAWDKFTSEYDLATIGMALLASNDGSSTMASNLGKALMAGRQAKLSGPEKARKEDLEERKVRATEKTAEAALLRASAAMKDSGEREIVDNASALKATSAWLAQQGVNKDAATAKAQEFATDVAEYHARSGTSMGQAQRRMLQIYTSAGLFQPTGLFTSGSLE